MGRCASATNPAQSPPALDRPPADAEAAAGVGAGAAGTAR